MSDYFKIHIELPNPEPVPDIDTVLEPAKDNRKEVIKASFALFGSKDTYLDLQVKTHPDASDQSKQEWLDWIKDGRLGHFDEPVDEDLVVEDDTAENQEDETSIKLVRLEALKDWTIHGHKIAKGDLSGWITSDTVIQQDGSWVSEDSCVISNSKLVNTYIGGRSIVDRALLKDVNATDAHIKCVVLNDTRIVKSAVHYVMSENTRTDRSVFGQNDGQSATKPVKTDAKKFSRVIRSSDLAFCFIAGGLNCQLSTLRGVDSHATSRFKNTFTNAHCVSNNPPITNCGSTGILSETALPVLDDGLRNIPIDGPVTGGELSPEDTKLKEYWYDDTDLNLHEAAQIAADISANRWCKIQNCYIASCTLPPLRDLDLRERVILNTSDLIVVGPLGSRLDRIVYTISDDTLTTGCFWGTLAEFENEINHKMEKPLEWGTTTDHRGYLRDARTCFNEYTTLVKFIKALVKTRSQISFQADHTFRLGNIEVLKMSDDSTGFGSSSYFSKVGPNTPGFLTPSEYLKKLEGNRWNGANAVSMAGIMPIVRRMEAFSDSMYHAWRERIANLQLFLDNVPVMPLHPLTVFANICRKWLSKDPHDYELVTDVRNYFRYLTFTTPLDHDLVSRVIPDLAQHLFSYETDYKRIMNSNSAVCECMIRSLAPYYIKSARGTSLRHQALIRSVRDWLGQYTLKTNKEQRVLMEEHLTKHPILQNLPDTVKTRKTQFRFNDTELDFQRWKAYEVTDIDILNLVSSCRSRAFTSTKVYEAPILFNHPVVVVPGPDNELGCNNGYGVLAGTDPEFPQLDWSEEYREIIKTHEICELGGKLIWIPRTVFNPEDDTPSQETVSGTITNTEGFSGAVNTVVGNLLQRLKFDGFIPTPFDSFSWVADPCKNPSHGVYVHNGKMYDSLLDLPNLRENIDAECRRSFQLVSTMVEQMS